VTELDERCRPVITFEEATRPLRSRASPSAIDAGLSISAVLIRLADELHDTVDVSDQLWADLKKSFSDEAVMQLLMMAGYYRTVAYVANGLRLPLEPVVGRPFPLPRG